MMSKTIYDSRYQELIAFLHRRRIELGLDQQQLAKQMGWSRNTVSRVELKDRRIDVLEALQLCQALQIHFNALEKVMQDATPDPISGGSSPRA